MKESDTQGQKPLAWRRATAAGLVVAAGGTGGALVADVVEADVFPAHGSHFAVKSCDTWGTHSGIGSGIEGQAIADTKRQACGSPTSIGVRMKWINRDDPHQTGYVGWKYDDDSWVIVDTWNDPSVNLLRVNPLDSNHSTFDYPSTALNFRIFP